MKRTLLLAVFCAAVSVTFSQPLTGVKTIKASGGDYNSFQAAIQALNLQGVGVGGVLFNVDAGFSVTEETDSINPAGSGIASPIIFQKSGAGANPVLRPTGNTATNNWGFRVSTADYVTFDGIDVNIASGQAVENGYYIDGTASNGAQNITIKNCNITLNKANTSITRGIYATSVATSASGANNNNHFYNFNITNVHRGVDITSSSSVFPDLNTEIGIEAGGTSTVSNQSLTMTTTFFGVFVNNQQDYKVFNVQVSGFATSITASSYGIRQSGTGAYGRIYNCNVSNLVNSSTGTITGISLGSGKTNIDHFVYNNVINNLSCSGAGTTNFVYGIESAISTTIIHIYDNTVSALSSSVNSTINSVSGITNSGASVSSFIYRNKIFNIVNINAGTSTIAAGMNVSGTNANIYNNYIYEISAPNSALNTTPATRGIALNTGTSQIKLFHNTVYLSYTSASVSNASAALYLNASFVSQDIRNNIFINNTDVTTGTRAVAHWRVNNVITGYVTSCDNNNYYAGIPSAKNLVYYDGTGSDQTLTAYKSRMGTREQHSITELSPFINTTPGFMNLHLNTLVPTQCESGGLLITSPISITADYDADVRIGTYTDIGADEGTFINDDKTGPYIVYNPLFNTTLTSARTLNTVIHDPSGVPSSGAGLPVLYWKINNGAYTATTGTFISGNTYQFSFGGGTVLNDSVFYYIAGQDANTTPTALSNPAVGAGGYSVNPPATSTPTTTPNAYKVVLPLSSPLNVGTGETYTSLTNSGGLFEAIRNNVITGNISVNITTDLTAETGTFDLQNWIEEGTGNYSVNIHPSSAVMKTISGNMPTQGLIRLNGADRVTIDGSFAESGRYLTIRNTGTIYSALFIGGDANNNTITNCILEAQTQNEQVGVIRFLSGSVNGNDSNTISNCIIRDRGDGTFPWSGVVSLSQTATNSHNKLLNNIIYNFLYYGYYGVEGNDNWTISGNEFYQTAAITAPAQNCIGMSFGATGTNYISNNKIHDLKIVSATNSICVGIMINNALNTYVEKNRLYNFPGVTGTSYGIYFAGSNASNANATLVNNQVSIIPPGNTNQHIIGIADESFNNNTLAAYYNSVFVGGNADAAATTNSWAYRRSPVGTGGSVNYLRNNIFMNDRTGPGLHFSIGNIKDAGISNFKISNNFYTGRNGTTPANYFNISPSGSATTGASFTSWVSTYKDIESYTMMTGNINANNLFRGKDTANLSIDQAKEECWFVNGKAMPMPGFGNDYINNNVRSVNIKTGSADVGAHEFTPAIAPPLIIPSGTHAPGGTEDYVFAGRKVASITWGLTGTLPDLFAGQHYTGTWPNDTTNNGNSANARFLNEWWDIPAILGSGYTYRMTLYYDSANLGKILNESTMVIQKKQNGVPGTWTAHTPSVVDLLDRSIYTDGLTSFSEFTASDLLAPIPVKLISFNAVKSNYDAMLNWVTDNESSNTLYLVERSFTGTLFSPVQNIAGRAVNGAREMYSFTDAGILQQYQVVYYRLKIIENGKTSYSPVAVVRNNSKAGIEIKQVITGNNGKTVFSVLSPAAVALHMLVISSDGKVVANQKWNAAAGWQLYSPELRNAASGMYILKVTGNGVNLSLPFIK